MAVVAVIRASSGHRAWPVSSRLIFFYFPSPNGMKVAIMPEECGFPYKVVEVDIGRGDQFRPEFPRISPNHKIPALVDHVGEERPVVQRRRESHNTSRDGD
jgi:hypothetical protein